jgi:Spy/CpxP family protein refolding chaperone
MKKMFVAIFVVTLLATSGLALAQGWGRGPGYGPEYGSGPCGFGSGGPGSGPEYGPKGAWGAGLNLTPEQNQKMLAVREAFFKETLPVRNEMQVKQLELRTLWAQTNPEPEKIIAKQKEVNALKTQLQEKGTMFRLEMRKILTPEQQAQMGAYGPGFGRGQGMRGGYGPGRGMGMGQGMGYGPCLRW